MLSECSESCRARGVSLETLSQEAIQQDATNGFAYLLHKGKDIHEDDCVDIDSNCESMALEGKCLEDSEYMKEHCAKTCLACFGSKPRTVTIDFGVAQQTRHEDPSVEDEVARILESTRLYMLNVFTDPKFAAVRRDCRNLDPNCAIYAAMGECHGTNDALAMFQSCAPVCHACHAVEYFNKCARKPSDVDVFGPGDMNTMFQTIVTKYSPTVVSEPTNESLSNDEFDMPWIVVLDDFATDEECDWLVATGHEIGFEQTSEITEEVEEDGTFGDLVGSGRTSLDAWCREDCEDAPIGKAVMNKMLEMTGVSKKHTEYMEILQYHEGGHYERHHDVIATQDEERCGNRILSFYLFLSDVEEGGELRFTDIDEQVTPKKGRAVLWQNVDDDDLGVLHPLTFHEAMPVKRGEKYGLNLWIHSRDMRLAMKEDCC